MSKHVQEEEEERKTSISMKVDSGMVSQLIGKGGWTRQWLQDQTGTEISLRQASPGQPGQLTITGQREKSLPSADMVASNCSKFKNGVACYQIFRGGRLDNLGRGWLFLAVCRLQESGI